MNENKVPAIDKVLAILIGRYLYKLRPRLPEAVVRYSQEAAIEPPEPKPTKSRTIIFEKPATGL
jgi:hypothetical protein